MDLRRVDLNLLVALESLLETTSVTAAARHTGITQSSMSHNLRRLRELFGDPLLVRNGRKMERTPRAEALRAPTQRILAEIQRLVAAEDAFDPATSQRVFAIACPDLLAAILPELLACLHRDGPAVSLEFHRPPRGDVAAALASGDELALGPPRESAPGLLQRRLGTVRWAVFGRAGHPALAGPLTIEAYTRYPHVLVSTGTPGPGFVGEALEAAGVDRRVGLTVESFLLAPHAVAASDLLYTGPWELIRPHVAGIGLASQPPPVALPEVPVNAYWPERVHHDPGHQWLRERVVQVVIEILGAD
ncbi:MAG: LysR family transcriptional regulator [Myxococcales bacterium]|nr:LysR family transcriptional regulator [Myxococcales bacterium]